MSESNHMKDNTHGAHVCQHKYNLLVIAGKMLDWLCTERLYHGAVFVLLNECAKVNVTSKFQTKPAQ